MIKRLYINNFRCLENFELPISGKSSSLLIGKNGSGKSTVGYALAVFQGIARGTNRVGQLVTPSDYFRVQTDSPLRFEIEALIGGKVYAYNLAFELPEGFRELRVFDERLAVDGKPIYSRDRAQVQMVGTKKDKEAKFLVDWHLVALPLIQEQSMDDPLYIFRTWLARMLIIAPIPSLITGESEDETLTPKRDLTDFGAWFSGILAHSPAAYTAIDLYLKQVMVDFKDVKNPSSGTDFRSIVVQFQQEQASLSLRFRHLSDGEKCFFICALVIAANEAYGPIFCYWDEPDNYLAPDEVQHFVMALRRSFNLNGQLLVTSHNVEAIRSFSDDNTFVLQRRSHLEPTFVRPLNELQVNGDIGNALLRGDVGE